MHKEISRFYYMCVCVCIYIYTHTHTTDQNKRTIYTNLLLYLSIFIVSVMVQNI